MNKYKIAAAAALAAAVNIAVPAAANEARIEARGGIIWAAEEEEATVGAAAGYDFDLGNRAFFGVEGSADKVLVDGSDIYWGLTGRAGIKAAENARLFLAGGYTVGEGEDVPHLGGGAQYNLGPNLFVKGEYRHFFSDFADGDSLVGGVGLRF